MNPTPKINLNAMTKKNKLGNLTDIKDGSKLQNPKIEENISSVIEIDEISIPVEEVKEEKKSMIPKISLSSIKTTKSPDEIKEEKEEKEETKHEEMKEELLETLEEDLKINVIKDDNNNEKILVKNDSDDNDIEKILVKNDSDDNDIEKTLVKNDSDDNNIEKILVKNDSDDNNIEKILVKNDSENKIDTENNVIDNNDATLNESIEEIERKINEKVEEEINKKLKKGKILKKIVENVDLDNKAELFGNYTSEFIEKEDIIIKKVETEKKKFMERLKEPKTRILLVLGLIFLTGLTISALFILDPKNHSVEIYKNSIEMNINNFKKNYISKEWKKEVLSVEKYNFDTYTQNKLFGGNSYKYDEKIYTKKEDMMQVINLKATEMKKEDERKKLEAENLKLEQERIEAENLRIEQERIESQRIRTEQEKKDAIQNEKTKVIIKDVLHEKYINYLKNN